MNEFITLFMLVWLWKNFCEKDSRMLERMPPEHIFTALKQRNSQWSGRTLAFQDYKSFRSKDQLNRFFHQFFGIVMVSFSLVINKVKLLLRMVWTYFGKKMRNSRPRRLVLTIKKICAMWFELVGHPSYPPDLAPSDIFLSESRKEFESFIPLKKFVEAV